MPAVGRRKASTLATGGVALLALAVLFSGCGRRKLDEFVFHQGPRFTLKLVRYYENLPLHYTGEVFRVQCSSAETKGSPAHDTQDAGWVSLSNGGAIGLGSAEAVAERERRNYVVLSDSALAVVAGAALGVSFDACGSFEWWNPTKLPREMIEAGQGVPSYTAIRSSGPGRIEFSVTSRAFRGVERVRVTSEDGLRTFRLDAE